MASGMVPCQLDAGPVLREAGAVAADLLLDLSPPGRWAGGKRGSCTHRQVDVVDVDRVSPVRRAYLRLIWAMTNQRTP